MPRDPAALHVLLVEDSASDAKLVARALSQSGFTPRWERVDTAPALRDALQRGSRGEAWDLVLSDSGVPGLGLLDVLATCKALAPTVPFIVVSGTITEQLAVEAIRGGAADYVTKGNLQRLGSVVARELGAGGPGTVARQPVVALRAVDDLERRRIARALHDQLGQIFVGLRLLLETAQRAKGAARTRALAEAIAVTEDAVQRVRDFSIELFPSVLDDLGLPAALRWLAERQARLSGLEIELDLAEIGRVPRMIETTGYRVAEEALANVVRHAAARTVHVSLRDGTRTLELVVTDDGRGFDPDTPRDPDRLGLAGMRERARFVGGELEVDAAVGRGTKIRLRIPMREDVA